MRRIWRLLRYARPYALYSLASVVLMAVVGAMAGLRLYLIKPIFDKVLRPKTIARPVLLLPVPLDAPFHRSCTSWCPAIFTMHGRWWRMR